MKVLLIKDLRGLGRKGEIKNVSDGYFKNYLFPNKIAVLATPEVERRVKEEAEQRKSEKEALLKELKKDVSRLSGEELVFHVKTDDKGSIFGSVTEAEIKKALTERGYKHFEIELAKPIRVLGEFEIVVRFEEGIRGVVKIRILKS